MKSGRSNKLAFIIIVIFIAMFKASTINAQLGIITTVAGNGSTSYFGDGGPATAAEFNSPYCVSDDTGGNFYIADEMNHVIRKVTSLGIITTVAGINISGY